jgi:universal stress protein E
MSAPSSHTTPPTEVAAPFRRVLAASFLDDAGTAAALRAARLPLVPGAQVTLLHVLHRWARRRSTAPDDALPALRRLGARVRDAAAGAGNDAIEVVPLLARGWPATEMVRAARETRAELVVVGPPATRFDGSARATILRVLRRAELPLLVARNDPWSDHRRIVCAVDGSASSAETIELAVRLARAAPGARRITFFHAYHVPFEEWADRAEARHRADAALARVRGLARAAMEVAEVRTVVRRGEFCAQLFRIAHAERAELVVVGTRSGSGLAKALVGSAAEWVVANSPWDVAVARPHPDRLDGSG